MTGPRFIPYVLGSALALFWASLPGDLRADPQSDALRGAVEACLSTTLAFDKRPRAMPGFADVAMDDSDVTSHAWANTLSFPVIDEVPYPLAGPALEALRPAYELYVRDYEAESRWLLDAGLMKTLRHPSGWSVILESDEFDPRGAFCTLWHPDPSEDARAELDRMAGFFESYPLPFANVTDIMSWRTVGIYDYDQSITIISIDAEQLPNLAPIYVLTSLFSYDLTADY